MSEAKKYQPAGTTSAQRQRARDIENAVFARVQPLETRIKDLEHQLATAHKYASELEARLKTAEVQRDFARADTHRAHEMAREVMRLAVWLAGPSPKDGF